ncbi:hypothetical protein BDZ97DRAFT_1932510 [Flammula alnicola]|nr:hypothetical protein BDZ97DRAFT_1932510 [Flammula alnicola]
MRPPRRIHDRRVHPPRPQPYRLHPPPTPLDDESTATPRCRRCIDDPTMPRPHDTAGASTSTCTTQVHRDAVVPRSSSFEHPQRPTTVNLPPPDPPAPFDTAQQDHPQPASQQLRRPHTPTPITTTYNHQAQQCEARWTQRGEVDAARRPGVAHRQRRTGRCIDDDTAPAGASTTNPQRRGCVEDDPTTPQVQRRQTHNTAGASMTPPCHGSDLPYHHLPARGEREPLLGYDEDEDQQQQQQPAAAAWIRWVVPLLLPEVGTRDEGSATASASSYRNGGGDTMCKLIQGDDERRFVVSLDSNVV